jgi:hypothetical protein
MLMKHRQGVWMDTDVYLVKPFSIDPARPFLARENRRRVGVSVLYLPSDNPVIADFERYIEGSEVLPEWLGLVRGRLRPAWYALTGKKVTPPSIGITVFGNDGISRLAKRHGFFNDAAQKESFYFWTAVTRYGFSTPLSGWNRWTIPHLSASISTRKAQRNCHPERAVSSTGRSSASP